MQKHGHLISNTTEDLKLVIKIKEQFGLVAQDFDAELKKANEQSNSVVDKDNKGDSIVREYTLPSGKALILKEERLKCAEMLFNPSHGNKDIEGIHKYTHDCIIKCDNDIRKDLFKNIVLAGGCTMFQGMKERMKKEI